MPIYSYQCPKCNHSFDKLVSYDDQKIECPRCRNLDVKRRVTVANVQYKGKGFYTTDSK